MSDRVEIGSATLILGDAHQIMAGMAHREFGAVVTDPPYGVGYVPRANQTVTGRDRLNQQKVRPQRHQDRIVGDDRPPPVDQMVRVGRHVITWGAYAYHDILPAGGGWLIWDKKEGGFLNWTGADADMAWTTTPGAPRLFHHTWVGLIKRSPEKVVGGANIGQRHPTEKPLALMEWCLAKLPAQTETVLDPFMGSGTTGEACARMGIKFTGIEIVPEYFELACRRIKMAESQGVLFHPQEASL